jgi:hypothetical protein
MRMDYKVEIEINRWNGFERALRLEDREAFHTLMDACRNYASAAENATIPFLFEPMAMFIMLLIQISLNKIRKELDSQKQQNNHLSNTSEVVWLNG